MFEPGTPVIYRTVVDPVWHYGIYDHMYKKQNFNCHYVMGASFMVIDKNILPFNSKNKYLIGTKTDPKNWNPTPGQLVAVSNNYDESVFFRVFVSVSEDGKYNCVVDGHMFDDNCPTTEWDYAMPASSIIEVS